MKRSSTNTLISLLAMVAILVIAYGMDRLILFLRDLSSRTASYNELTLVSYSLAHLLLAVLLLALFYRFVFQAPTNRWSAWIFLIVGLGICLYPAIYFTPIAEWLRLPTISFIGVQSFFITSGAFIAVTGASALWWNYRKPVLE